MGKKKILEKKNKELIDFLMGFYQVMVSIFEAKFPSDPIRSILTRVHLFEIINFHKRTAEEKGITIPEMGETFREYINKWNEYILTKESDLQNVIKNYNKKSEVPSYVS